MATATAKKAHRAEREDIQTFLEEKAVLWEFRASVPLAEFDLDRSLKNQARINQVLNEATVETYVDAMKRGDVFPAILAYKDGGKLIAIDGNHRLQAAKIAGTNIAAYIIDAKTDPKTIVLMTYEANAKHGLPNAIDERLRHAVYMVKNGTTQEVAAARLNVTLASLKRAYGKSKADDRAEEVGLLRSKWESLGIQAKLRLGAISSDEIFSAAADLAFKAKFDSSEIDAMVTSLNRERSTVRQRGSIETLTAVNRLRIQESGGGVFNKRGRAHNSKTLVYMGFGQLLTAVAHDKSLLDSLAIQEEADFLKRCQQAIDDVEYLVELVKVRQKAR